MYICAFIHFMVSNITVNHWLINSANFLLCQNKWTSCSDVHHFQLNVTELVIVYICIMLHLWRRRCEFLEIPSLSLPVTWNQSNDASHCTYWALKRRRYRWFELTFIHTWCLHTHTHTHTHTQAHTGVKNKWQVCQAKTPRELSLAAWQPGTWSLSPDNHTHTHTPTHTHAHTHTHTPTGVMLSSKSALSMSTVYGELWIFMDIFQRW